MDATKESAKKEKRPRGANWAPDALKAVLEMGILRREKIKGCLAVGDVKDGAIKEISDAVSATGQPKTPQECINKLRTYPSEVKGRFTKIAREQMRTGASGGDLVKTLQPTEIEALALAFLGVEKLSDLEKTLKKVTADAKKAARKKYAPREDDSSGDESDRDSLFEDSMKSRDFGKIGGRGKKQAQNINAGVLNRIVETLDRIEDRLIRVEQKGDDMHDVLSELKADRKDGTEEGGKEQTSKSNDTAEEQSPTMSTEEAEAEAEPPKVPAIPYTDIRAAFEDFFRNASEDDWDDMMKAAVTRKMDQKKIREGVYLKIIANLSEDDIDDLQAYFIAHFPKFITETIHTKNHYHVLTAVGCDLVAYGKFGDYLTDPEVLDASNKCRVLRDVPNEETDKGAGDSGDANATANQTDVITPGTAGDQEMEVNDKTQCVTPRKGKGATGIPRRTPTRKATFKSPQKGSGGKGAPVTNGHTKKDSSKGDDPNDVPESDKDSAPIAKRARRGRPKK